MKKFFDILAISLAGGFTTAFIVHLILDPSTLIAVIIALIFVWTIYRIIGIIL